MIAFIEGKVEEIDFAYTVVNAGGVGYYIHTPGNIYGKVSLGEHVRIHTYQSVREDDISLFGFIDKADKQLFQLLIQVSGIGPKVALNIVGAAPLERLCQAIIAEDMVFLTKLPGIGKKTAQRILLDLKDKVKDMYPQTQWIEDTVAKGDVQSDRGQLSYIMQDTISALESLGYTSKESETVVHDLIASVEQSVRSQWSVDMYIKKCLQRLMQETM